MTPILNGNLSIHSIQLKLKKEPIPLICIGLFRIKKYTIEPMDFIPFTLLLLQHHLCQTPGNKEYEKYHLSSMRHCEELFVQADPHLPYKGLLHGLPWVSD